MSGRKQHFIPQNLLRAFGSKGKGSKIQVVAYTRDRGIFTAATDGVGAERNFYSELAVEGALETLDDKITTYETPISTILVGLRSLDDGGAAEAAMAAELVTHLAIRNDHFRRSASYAATAMFDRLADTMAQEDTAKAFLGLAGDRPSALFIEQLSESFEQNSQFFAALGIGEEQFREIAFIYLKGNFHAVHRETFGPMAEALSSMTQRAPEIAATAQKRGLDTELSPKARVERMKIYSWHVMHTSTPSVLPDCVAVAFGEEGAAAPLMFAGFETTQTIVMPLGSNRLLIGSRGAHAYVPPALNEIFASCSWDFFVADRRTPDLEKMVATLRTRTGLYLDEAVDDAMNGALLQHSDP